MKFKEELEKTGRIPTYKVEDEYELLCSLSDSKPSKRIVNNKKGLKAIKALVDIQKNHNVSWYRYVKDRADKVPHNTALFYRGNEITYKELFSKADIIARSMLKIGVKPGDEIPICMTNTPELVYILLAINKIGVKANIFGEQFNNDYIKEILNECSKKVLFTDDSRYEYIKDAVQSSNIANKVVVSLADSIPKNITTNKYYELELDEYYHYPNKVKSYKQNDNSILSFGDFEKYGINSTYNFENIGSLEDDFLITYTSGSTIVGRPKPIMHKNRSLIVSGRFHDCELSGNPNMKKFSCLAHIPPESNTDLIACISDILIQGWTVCLEPEYDYKKALDYIVLNKPNYLNMTTSFFIEAAKQYLIEGKFKGRKLDSIFTAFAVGEKLSPGEEKFINKFLRKARAGSAVPINGFKMPFTTIGVAAGDCEHGAIFYTLWKKIFELKSKAYGIKECGIYPEAYVNATVLKINSKGEYEECDYGEMGIIVSNSYSNMSGYKNNPDATRKLLITDNLGRTWLSCNVYGYMDKLGGVHIKGRKELLFPRINGNIIPLYELEETVLSDTKRVMSCQVVENNGEIVIIVQPQNEYKTKDIRKSIVGRIINKYGEDILKNIDLIILPFEDSFPLTHSGKRELSAKTLLDKFKRNEDSSIIDGPKKIKYTL